MGDWAKERTIRTRDLCSKTDRRPVWLKEKVSHRNNQGPDTWGQGMDFGFYSKSGGKTLEGSDERSDMIF